MLQVECCDFHDYTADRHEKPDGEKTWVDEEKIVWKREHAHLFQEYAS